MSNKLKRNYIRLVENPEAEEIKLETYLTPHFIPLDVLYEATDVMSELEQAENGEIELSFKDQLDKLIDVVVKSMVVNLQLKILEHVYMHRMQSQLYKNKLSL